MNKILQGCLSCLSRHQSSPESSPGASSAGRNAGTKFLDALDGHFRWNPLCPQLPTWRPLVATSMMLWTCRKMLPRLPPTRLNLKTIPNFDAIHCPTWCLAQPIETRYLSDHFGVLCKIRAAVAAGVTRTWKLTLKIPRFCWGSQLGVLGESTGTQYAVLVPTKYTCIHTYIHTYIRCVTLRYVTLPYVTLRCVTLRYVTLHYTLNTLHTLRTLHTLHT